MQYRLVALLAAAVTIALPLEPTTDNVALDILAARKEDSNGVDERVYKFPDTPLTTPIESLHPVLVTRQGKGRGGGGGGSRGGGGGGGNRGGNRGEFYTCHSYLSTPSILFSFSDSESISELASVPTVPNQTFNST